MDSKCGELWQRYLLTSTAAPSNKKGSLITDVRAVSEPLGLVATIPIDFVKSFYFAKIATSMKSSI